MTNITRPAETESRGGGEEQSLRPVVIKNEIKNGKQKTAAENETNSDNKDQREECT